jgi:hypothetical protein
MFENAKKSVFTKDYFYSQLLEFRELMGKKSFWEDLDKVGIALKALFFTYTKIPSKEFDTKVENSMLAVTDEYNKRLVYEITRKK